MDMTPKDEEVSSFVGFVDIVHSHESDEKGALPSALQDSDEELQSSCDEAASLSQRLASDMEEDDSGVDDNDKKMRLVNRALNHLPEIQAPTALDHVCAAMQNSGEPATGREQNKLASTPQAKKASQMLLSSKKSKARPEGRKASKGKGKGRGGHLRGARGQQGQKQKGS